mmetsp:Transcript_2486/g.7288  ORF Transcript_2486/g.7288 Transcript_2486/m.7288 type:complete len:356 (+) Transcript_2486:364-1431(+)
MILDAVHVARGYTKHIAGRQQEALGRLGQKLRIALIGIGQREFQRLGLAARHIEDLTAQTDRFGILDAGGRQVELTGDPAGEVADALLVEGLGGAGDDLALLLAALGQGEVGHHPALAVRNQLPFDGLLVRLVPRHGLLVVDVVIFLSKLLGIERLDLPRSVRALVIITIPTLPLALPALLLGRWGLALLVRRGVRGNDGTDHSHIAHGLPQTPLLPVRHVFQPLVLPVREGCHPLPPRATAAGVLPVVVVGLIVAGTLQVRDGDDGVTAVAGGVAMTLAGRRREVGDPVGVRDALGLLPPFLLLLAVVGGDFGGRGVVVVPGGHFALALGLFGFGLLGGVGYVLLLLVVLLGGG